MQHIKNQNAIDWRFGVKADIMPDPKKFLLLLPGEILIIFYGFTKKPFPYFILNTYFFTHFK